MVPVAAEAPMTPLPNWPLQPSRLLKTLTSSFFDRIIVDEKWVSSVRAHAAEGTVVYVLRSLNFVDFLALDHLTKRYGLPQIRFVNELGLGPLGKHWFSARRDSSEGDMADQLRRALSASDGSAVLFLRRPPKVWDVAAGSVSGMRAVREGDELLRALIELQRGSERPILLVPQVFVWTRLPDTRGTRPLDLLLGPREWPSAARVAGQFLTNYRNVSLRAGQPINLEQFLEEFGELSDTAVRNKLVFTMLRRLERERRSVTGPVGKAPDRVRREILRSKRFQTALDKLTSSPEERREALAHADQVLSQMQAMPDGTTRRLLDIVLGRVFERIYHGLDVDQAGIERLREFARHGTFVLLPSHKSHIDYLVVSYVFNKANLPLPLIVAGENLSFFPMGGIFRRGGAFFIRRSFRGDRLYAVLVDAYVRRQIKDGFAIELFLEGMRSRTGKLLNPKFGLLSMIVSAVLGQDTRPVFFVPISIGYERIVETESFSHEVSGGEKVMEDAAGLLRSTEVLRHRYGRINLQFGEPQTLSSVAEQIGCEDTRSLSPKQTRAMVVRLGNIVLDEINRVTAVTPGALTALALLSHHRRGITHDKLLAHCELLLKTLTREGARTAPTLMTDAGVLRREAIREAAQMFVDADMVEVHTVTELSPRRQRKPKAGVGAIYTLVATKRLELDTSKNIIIHFFVNRALVATALLSIAGGTCTEDDLVAKLQGLAKLLRYEFRFGDPDRFEETFRQTIQTMLERDELERTDSGQLRPGRGRDGYSGHKWLLVYSAMLRNFIESYRIFVRSLRTLLDGAIAEKELLKNALATGSRMYLAGEVERPEAVSKPTFQNAITAFNDLRVIRMSREQVRLGEEFATEAALDEVEAGVAIYLEREGVE
jgi:glycerol-3-phosphate O-acyltransferase